MDTDNSNVKFDEDEKMVPLKVFVEYSKKLTNMNVAKEVILILYRVLRRVGGTDKDYEMVDGIEEGVIKNMMSLAGGNTIIEPKNVMMKDPQVESIYRITGNENVNLGGLTNE